MKPTLVSLKYPAMALAAAALCIGAGVAPAAAQSEGCADLYGRVMGLYQTAPSSPEYNRVSAYYSSRCLTGSSVAPAYTAPYQPYIAPSQPYVSYDQTAPVYPGAIAVGGFYEGNRWDGDRRFR